MTPAHLHLLLNHLPVFGLVFGLLVMLYAHRRSSRDLHRASYFIVIIAALGTVPVYLSGGGAEETVEGMPDISEPLIESHEEIALIALIFTLLVGAAALLGVYLLHRYGEVPPGVRGLIVILAAAVMVLLALTGNRGGKIAHPELRAGYVASASTEIEHGHD